MMDANLDGDDRPSCLPFAAPLCLLLELSEVQRSRDADRDDDDLEIVKPGTKAVELMEAD